VSVDLKVGRVVFGPVVTGSPAFRVMEFERSFREAAAAGKSPDALRRHVTDEIERFWAYTIPGPDGHVYWDGPLQFRRNDGKHRRPARWVRERTLRQALPVTTDVWSTCGETNCISPDHLTSGRTPKRMHYPDERIIGAGQVMAMRLGHPPSAQTWDDKGGRPIRSVIVKRWGTWANFLIACGLDPKDTRPHYHRASAQTVRAGIRALARHLGRRPTFADWEANREWLRANEHPTSPTTVKAHLGDGSFNKAVDEALK
jgi:hypothetical protein